jgi:SNF2 family DNA or RNA helicase
MQIGSLTLDATDATRALFPDVPPENGKITLAHTPAFTIPLRAVGIEVPPSIRTTYDWCGGTPFEIQMRTCEMMTENPRSYVLNSMGTGKTRCALWSFDYLKKLGLVNKMLVVCPLSTMTFTWGHEIMKASPHLRWTVLHGTAQKRRDRLADESMDVYIINHDGLRVVAKEIANRKDIDVVLLDELAVYRNNTVRTKIAGKVTADKAVVWGMTGSPMPNFVTDIYQQIKIITPWRVPKYFSWLRDELMFKVSQFKWVNKVGAIDKAFDYMQPSVRYTLDDIMELPEAYVPPPQYTELSDEQKRIYDSIRKYCTVMVANKEITAMNAGVVMAKLLQASAGWIYDSKRNIYQIGGEARLQALADIVEGAAGKTIVFVNYLHALHGVAACLKDRGFTPHVVEGSTPLHERTRIFNVFQNTDDRSPLVVYPKCISHGLTLTAADTAVWFLPPLSAETYDQCNARIRRVGQTRKQLFVHLCSTPIERQVYNLLTNRLLQQDSFLRLLEDASWD